ncbi:MAG: PadR family transcriptional regulator [Phycisphaerales bacterium]|nr:PadR family transcriptional regulator [Phycisphaerales bacterium]
MLLIWQSIEMGKEKIIKGSLSVLILQLLQNNRVMYGYEITKAVKEANKGKMQLSEADLYPTLHKLESEGRIETESLLINGRVRRYYKLTQQGNKASIDPLAIVKEAIRSL